MATQTNVVHSLASHLIACANKLWIEKLVSSAMFTFRAVHFYIYCYCFFIWFCWKLISPIWIGEKNEMTAMTPLLLLFQFLSFHVSRNQSIVYRFCVAVLLPDAWLDKAQEENEKLMNPSFCSDRFHFVTPFFFFFNQCEMDDDDSGGRQKHQRQQRQSNGATQRFIQISFCEATMKKKIANCQIEVGSVGDARVDGRRSVTEINFWLSCANCANTHLIYDKRECNECLPPLPKRKELEKYILYNLLKIQTFTIWSMTILRWMQKAKIALHRCFWRWNTRKICATIRTVCPP